MKPSRVRPLAAVLATLSLALVTQHPVMAAGSTPAPTVSATADSSKTAWVATSKVYKAALLNREITVKAINEEFTKAVKRAKKDFSAAMAKATTPAQKSAAAARFKDAIDRASALRQAALDSLPALPPLPGAKVASR